MEKLPAGHVLNYDLSYGPHMAHLLLMWVPAFFRPPMGDTKGIDPLWVWALFGSFI